ncbi:LamG domain-containing protein [Micromonospora sp. NPDC049089]|uniref:LamG domain-containing protein n=1 Tax=Micromonospora sp. NPDC049089 TaxID=3155496 RepID=UPI0033C47DF6
MAPSENAAISLARTCETAVEVLAAASETTKVFAQPSGELTLESWAEPQWAKVGSRWRGIDTTLVVGGDGRVRPVASTADVVFSQGGQGPFATMTGAGADFSLGWPSALPQGVIHGDTITYPNVYPDVDLVVRAERGGFSHLLVVKSAVAAKNPAVRETRFVLGGSADVAVTDNRVTISGPGGLFAAAPPAMAWDSTAATGEPSAGKRGAGALDSSRERAVASSSVSGPSDAAAVARVDVRVDKGSLTVAVDPAVLSGTQFPVFIDPSYDMKWARWAPVNDSNGNTQWTSGSSWPREVARVGSNWDDHGDIWRSHFYFDISAMSGRRLVNTTSVDAYLVHTGNCNESLGIWQTNSLASSTPTWNGMAGTWLHEGPLQTKTVGANCGQSANWQSFNGGNVGYHVQRHANAGAASITFGLRMGNESGGHWAKFDPANVRLKATYQSRPSSPVAIRTSPGGNCSTASPGPWVNVPTPTLYGKASDGDGSVKVQFDINGPTNPPDHTSAWTTSGVERGWTAPALVDGAYNWRVRGYDDVDGEATGWTGYCYFRVDHTAPTTPVVTRVSGTPVAGAPVTLSFTSADAMSGVKQFAYGIGTDAMQAFQASGGTTTVTFTPEVGRTVVYVWAQDNAGNYSARTAFNFFTGRITQAQPQATWRLDGDGFDDSGQGRDLTLGSGVSYGADRKGVPGAALAMNGAGCAKSAPTVRTDAEYTVSGWVNLADKSSLRTVFAQVGTARPSFYLLYHHVQDRWELVVTGGDFDGSPFVSVFAPTSTPLGQWQHVAATVDPVARIMRLYVNGQFASEGEIPFTPWNATSQFLVGCFGSANSELYHLIGGIDHVGVWQGLLSDEQIARAATELPAGLVGDWQLRGSGAESTGRSSDAVVPEDVPWVEDQHGRVASALQLNGRQQCATTSGPTVRTDESFTIATWVKVDDKGLGNQTVIGQDGERQSGWYLGTRVLDGTHYWGFLMMDVDADDSSAPWARSPAGMAADVGRWTHLTGVYDATAQRITLYVNGVLASSAPRLATPWQANGPVTIGCARYTGIPVDHVVGSVSGVQAWQGALTAAQVAAAHGGNPGVKLEGLWPLDGPASDTPTYLTDTSGNGRDLTITGPYAWARDRGFGRDGALGLELAENSCAEAPGPLVRTDASFTLTAWVLLEKATGHHTVMSQISSGNTPFYLGYHPGVNRWHFGMPDSPARDAVWRNSESQQPPALGKWTHLAGVYDLGAGKVRLYVDGVAQGEVDGPVTPWMAPGPTLIGCVGESSGSRHSRLGGVVDDVRIWTSTLAPERIADLAAG